MKYNPDLLELIKKEEVRLAKLHHELMALYLVYSLVYESGDPKLTEQDCARIKAFYNSPLGICD